MRHLLVLLVALVIAGVAVAGDEPAIKYGTLPELKGAKSYFVDAGLEADVRNRIVEVVTKAIASERLALTESADSADVVITYRVNKADFEWQEADVYLTRVVDGESKLLHKGTEKAERGGRFNRHKPGTYVAEWFVKQFNKYNP